MSNALTHEDREFLQTMSRDGSNSPAYDEARAALTAEVQRLKLIASRNLQAETAADKSTASIPQPDPA